MPCQPIRTWYSKLLQAPAPRLPPTAARHGAPTGVQPASYRADIDGLRAVAVLLVLIFHGGLALFPSGFIGVDIFFVISGYLTTSIILGALSRGDFNLGQFYVKRLWRLQPAILALLIVTLGAASVLYLPKDFIDFLKSEKYTSLLLSNQYFSKATDGYATAEAATLPCCTPGRWPSNGSGTSSCRSG